LRQDASHN